VEQEGGGGPGAAGDLPPQTVPPPVTVSGSFGERGDRDRFQFPAKAGQPLSLDVDARELGSLADATLRVLDAAGKLLATVDDSDRSRDPKLLWTPPVDGTYTIGLRDVAGGSRGGAAFFYRLTIAPPAPAFSLTTATHTPVLKPGAKLEIPISVTRSFLPSPVTVSVEGLPPGVTADPATVPASPGRSTTSEIKLVLSAAADAKPASAPIRIAGTTDGLRPVRARSTWVLSTDRSGTLADGSTETFLLVIPAP
jgi:hypothetical protein